MARYKYGQYLSQSDSSAYDDEFEPGETPRNSGLYRCTGCGDEIVAEKSRKFPPQNRHQHSDPKVPIRWKLLVFPQSKYDN